MADGLRMTLKAIPGLTVDENGRKLLQAPFTFQCPPMEEFKVVRQFTFTNYDTIADGQFTRRGSRQLRTWEFDTILMELGHVDGPRYSPSWVPNPAWEGPGVPYPPEWFLYQLQQLHDAGAPFSFIAEFPGVSGSVTLGGTKFNIGTVLSCPTVLLGLGEGYKAGEGDAIYLEGVSFSEWRDPLQKQRALGTNAQHHGRPSDRPPTSVTLLPTGVARTPTGRTIPSFAQITNAQRHGSPRPVTTLARLSKFFYHTPTHWRDIADANGLHGGSQNMALTSFKRYARIPKTGVTVKIPELQQQPQTAQVPARPVTGGVRL